MPDQTKKFRGNATEARAKAANASDPANQRMLLEVATTWDILASDHEDSLLADQLLEWDPRASEA